MGPRHSISVKRLILSLIVLAPLALPAPSFAQDLRRIAPQPAPVQSGAPLVEPEPEQGGSAAVVVARLRGLVFVSRPEAVKPVGAAVAAGTIDTSGVPELANADFRELMRPYLGQPVSLASLHAMVADVVAYYRQHDRIFVAATVPDQDISSGVIQVLVVEGKLDQVRVEGAKWFGEDEYREDIRATPGGPLSQSVLNADLDWINQNPFRHAQIVASAGSGVGTTDLTLQVKDRFPVRFYTGYDDSGTRVSDENRFLAGFNWGNPFGRADQLNYQFTGSPDFDTSVGHSGSYLIQLPWRHTLTVAGAYSTIHGNLAAPFNLSGMSWQAGFRYGIPLPDVATQVGLYSHQFNAGFDFKESNNNLEFSNMPVTNNLTDIAQWVFDYTGTLQDNWGVTRFDASLVYSPGGWLPHNNDFYFNVSNPGAKAEYTYGSLDIERTQRLPWNFSLILTGHGQLSDGNLIGSEQMPLGGFSAVRGYEEDAAYGDEGYLLKQELRLPPFSLSACFMPKFGENLYGDQLQFLVFHDYGVAHTAHLTPGNPQDITLESAGVGFRYTFTQYLAVRFDYGWQLHDPGADVVDPINQRAHFSLVFSY
jgi:hemolysin activation/secretion protein